MVHFTKRFDWLIDVIKLAVVIVVIVVASIKLYPHTTLADISAVGMVIIGLLCVAAAFNMEVPKKRTLTIGVILITIGVIIGSAHNTPKLQSAMLTYMHSTTSCDIVIQPDDGVIQATASGDWHVVKLTFYSQSEFESKLAQAIKDNRLENCTQHSR